MPRRSLLFSPGDRPEMMRKAPSIGADALIFDLEDAVAPDAKADARATVRDVVADLDLDGTELCVRINPLNRGGDDDVRTVAPLDGVDTLVVPMVDGAEAVRDVATLAEAVDADVGLLPILEIAEGVLRAEAIANAPSVTGLAFGAEDFRAQLGAAPLPGGDELAFARGQVVTAATAAGVDAIDTVYTDIEDMEGFAEEAEYVRGLGYDGKTAIHPAQVDVINDAFTPERDEVEWAERVLVAKREADERNAGTFRVDGEMVDEPVVERAKTVLERAGRDPIGAE